MRRFNVAVNGMRYEVEVEEVGVENSLVSARTAATSVATRPVSAQQTAPAAAVVQHGAKTITAPMPGTILRISVKPGESVTKGQMLIMLEAMKMENEIKSGAPGVVESIMVKEGETVNTGQVLIILK